MTSVTDETLMALKEAQATSIDGQSGDDLRKTYTQATGLVNYDLERPAKSLFPVMTPLRNIIPRVKAHGGTQANWKAITAINVNKILAGVSEGQRGGIVEDTVLDYFAAFVGLGLEQKVTFEAQYASAEFDNARARAALNLLRSTMIAEERIILTGNGTYAIGTTPTPTVLANAGGTGSLSNQSYSVICVALTGPGHYRSSITAGIPQQIVRNNADGTTNTINGGAARKSVAAAVTANAAGSISATVTPVRGAVAYAWFWGASGSETLGAITTVASVLITAAATGTQLASALAAADYSQDSLVFDGLITQIAKPGYGAYYRALENTTNGKGKPLTGDGAAGIVEIDEALTYFWDTSKLSPDTIWVSSREYKAITKNVIANNGAPLVRINLRENGQRLISAGQAVGTYFNSLGSSETGENGSDLQIRVHPFLAPGTILFTSSSIPYPTSNVGDPLVIQTRQEYYQTDWPLRTRAWEMGVYVDEVMKNYFPPAFGMITNIGTD